jgi:hypothetical protein
MGNLLNMTVALCGAAIVTGSCMVTGLRVHRFMVRYAPALAPPSELAVIVGLIFGASVVAQWFM